MAARWTLHSYWNFVHKVAEKYDVPISIARAVYRDARDREGSKIHASYVLKHPRLTAGFVSSATERAGEQARARGEREGEREIDELAEWDEQYDEAEDFEEEEFTGAFDTGKGKRK